jgi:DNA-binding SARP family transcriptional activator/transcriptional regulator with XRE-family HTH domain
MIISKSGGPDQGDSIPVETQMDLGKIFQARRLAAGISQQQLAELAKVGTGTVRDLEQGRTRSPHSGSIVRLAQALRFSAVEITTLTSMAYEWPAKTGLASRRPVQPGVPARGFWLQTLGPLRAWFDPVVIDFGAPKPRAILGMLALTPGTLMHREALIDGLWAENPPPSGVNLVQTYVSRLRRALEHACPQPEQRPSLISAGNSYGLCADATQLDLVAFEDLVSRARAACARGRTSDLILGCGLYQQALDLWQGDLLADIDLLRSHPAVISIRQRRDAIVVEFGAIAASAGRHEQALPYLRSVTDRDELNEPAHAQLMILLAGVGQQAAALRVFEELRMRLDTQLGVAPCAQLAQAQLRVLRQDVCSATATAMIQGGGQPATPSRPAVPRSLPILPPHFTGRAGELRELTAALDGTLSGRGAIVAILGMAGIGKSALAAHWAHLITDRFPDGQLYVDMRGFGPLECRTGPDKALHRFLELLSVPAERIPVELEARVSRYRSLLTGTKTLVVVDDARDEDDVRPLLPGSPGCLLIVTSRSQLAGLVAAEGAYPLTLTGLTVGESQDLIASRIGIERASADPDATAELVRLCAGLPLALNITAARALSRPAAGMAAHVAELRDTGHRLDALETGDPAASIRVSFHRSYEQLTPAAARVFRLLSLHSGRAVTVPIICDIAEIPADQARAAIDELVAQHMLTEQALGSYRCHDLLSAYAAELALRHETEVSCARPSAI